MVAGRVARIDRSIDRLYRLNHAFSVYEAQIEWTDKDVSPDPAWWSTDKAELR